jgi:hypothetical protein
LQQVTQSRLAVDVSSPVGLVQHLEGLTGAEDYEAKIEQQSRNIEHVAAGMEAAEHDVSRCAGGQGRAGCPCVPAAFERASVSCPCHTHTHTHTRPRRLERVREVLAPAVAHWQQVQELEARVSETKLQLLTDQQEHGGQLLQLLHQQVGVHDALASSKLDRQPHNYNLMTAGVLCSGGDGRCRCVSSC